MPTTKSGKYVLTRSPSDSTINPSCWNDMGNFLLISFASIVVPSGYSNDYKMHHPRIKGGLYLILNYLVNMTIMGVSLGYTILHRVPNDFHGIHLKNPSINVNIPDVGIGIGIGGNVIKIKMPQNKVSQNLIYKKTDCINGRFPSISGRFFARKVSIYIGSQVFYGSDFN